MSDSIQTLTNLAPCWQHHGKVDIQVGCHVFPALICDGSMQGLLRLAFFREDLPYLVASLGQSITLCQVKDFFEKVPVARVGHLEFTLCSDRRVSLEPQWAEEGLKIGPCQQPISIECQLIQSPCSLIAEDSPALQVFVQKSMMLVFSQFDQRAELSTLRASLNNQSVAISLDLSSNFFLPELFHQPTVWKGRLQPSMLESPQTKVGIQGQGQIETQLKLFGLSVQVTLTGDLLACAPYEVRQEAQGFIDSGQESPEQQFFSKILKMDRWSWVFRQGFLEVNSGLSAWCEQPIPILMSQEHGLCIGPLPSYSLENVTEGWDVFSDFEQAIGSLGNFFSQFRKPQDSLMDLEICVAFELEVRKTHLPFMRLGWHCVFKAQNEKLFDIRLKTRHQIQENFQCFDQLMEYVHLGFDQTKAIFINHLLHDPGALIIFIKKYYHLSKLKTAITGCMTASEPHTVLVGALSCLFNDNEKDIDSEQVLAVSDAVEPTHEMLAPQGTNEASIDPIISTEAIDEGAKESASLGCAQAVMVHEDTITTTTTTTTTTTEKDVTFKPWIVRKQNGEVKILWPLAHGIDEYHVYLRTLPLVPIRHSVVSAQEASKGLVLSKNQAEAFLDLPHVLWCSIYSRALEENQITLEPVFVYIPTLQVQRWFVQERLQGWQWEKPNFSVLYYWVTVSCIGLEQSELIASCRLEPDSRVFDLKEIRSLLILQKSYQMRIKAKIFEQPGAYAWTPVTCFNFAVS